MIILYLYIEKHYSYTFYWWGWTVMEFGKILICNLCDILSDCMGQEATQKL